ncbi:MAG: four helix bundle protein [Bacteroidales bacterium]|nr:four helix bundle protein [Bacteroidales bacterium]
MERQDLDSLEIYQLSLDIADEIWDIVIQWDHFAKNAIGYQIVKASDSIAANISEGYGRYFYKENRQFCFIARGSLYETRTFLKKPHRRNLVTLEKFDKLSSDLDILVKKLNAYIKYIESKMNTKRVV